MEGLITNKAKLFGVISLSVVGILSVPAILPHITHPSMIYHILLHIGSLIITVFLSVISIIAYNRTGSIRILFMTAGFLSLVVVEFLSLFAATENLGFFMIPGVNVEVSHMFLLGMLALFGLGVLKVDK
ncbi:MAG: hypothetical protein ACRD38_00440 [Nitrososphaerales archaeon]